MMKFNTLKDVVRFRIVESEEKYWVEDYWKTAVDMFSKDIDATIEFIQNECDDEELYALSEIFEALAKKTLSKELIQALRIRTAKVTPENYRQENFKSEYLKKWVDYKTYVKGIEEEIDFAESAIEAATEQKEK